MYDAEIREVLFDYLDEYYGKNRILEEKRMGRSRADLILLVEYELIGLEIKSDADTYTRLQRQMKDYNRYCDRNYIVVGQSHRRFVEKHVDEEWGILCVSDTVEMLREAKMNPRCKLEHQIEWMWRPELHRILIRNQLPEYRQKSKEFVQQKLLQKVEPMLLKQQMCDELFERDYQLIEEEINQYKSAQRQKKQMAKKKQEVTIGHLV
ncbi:MAG: sce7726 family protein [Lachnospiraceae bacterium]